MGKRGPNFALLREAAAVVDGIPAKHFDLQVVMRDYADKPRKNHCGTIGCAMGWLGLHPVFMRLGLKVYPHEQYAVHWKGRPCDLYTAAQRLFHISYGEAWALFNGASPITAGEGGKRLFRRRVKHFLQQHRQPVSREWLKRC